MATEVTKAERFMDAVQKIDPHTANRMFNLLKDAAERGIVRDQDDILRMERFRETPLMRSGLHERDDVVVEMAVAEMRRQIGFYPEVVDLANCWKDAEREYSVPHIVAALTATHRPPKKKGKK